MLVLMGCCRSGQIRSYESRWGCTEPRRCSWSMRTCLHLPPATSRAAAYELLMQAWHRGVGVEGVARCHHHGMNHGGTAPRTVACAAAAVRLQPTCTHTRECASCMHAC